MFASKTLAERNNDPRPWVIPGTYDALIGAGNMRFMSWFDTGNDIYAEHDPRPEFQHGKLEVNPILLASRHYTNDVKSYWVHRLAKGDLPAGVTASPAQIKHSHRVLTLWLAVFA